MKIEAIFSQIEGFNKVMKDKLRSQKRGIEMSKKSNRASILVNQLHPKKMNLKVSEIIDELTDKTNDVKTFRLVRTDDSLPPFEAGQFINLSVTIDSVTTSRAYSISSAPSQHDYIDITVKRVDGGFVSNNLLDDIKVGDELESTSPSGEFHYNPIFHGDDLVMLAGGSGITPIMSMIREFIGCGSGKIIHLVYICRTPADVIFCNELEALDADNNNFAFTKVISRPEPGYIGITGHITAELLKSLLENANTSLQDKTWYVCGPTGMCESAKNDLLDLGIRLGKIRQESFGETADVTKMEGWPAEVRRGQTVNVKVLGGESFDAPVGEPLLNSLDRVGVSVPSSCHAGECSLCRVKLVDGEVFQLTDSKERSSDKLYGYIHSCSSYPTNDIEIEI